MKYNHKKEGMNHQKRPGSPLPRTIAALTLAVALALGSSAFALPATAAGTVSQATATEASAAEATPTKAAAAKTSAAARTAVPVSRSGGAAAEDGLLLDGITYVAFRAFTVFADNCEVRWDGDTRTATAVTPAGNTISAKEGETVLRYGGRRFYTAAPIRVIGDRLYVPLRPLAKCFGMEVTWSVRDRSVTLGQTQAVSASASVYDEEDLYWLARIIGAEAGGESFAGKVAVGNVILNRVAHEEYPDSVRAVIFDRKYGVQFTPAATGSIYRTPSAEDIDAAKVCLEGYRLSTEILYFFNPEIASSSWIARNRTYEFRIGNHVFYR